jgi:hypothetical protein
MKKSVLLTLAFAMFVPAVSLAQDAPKPATQASASGEAPRVHKPRTVAGFVSADAKTFLDGKQSQWTVVNPTALTGYENQRVKVKYLLATDQKQIQVLSVKPAEAQTQNAAFKTDSAFRR